MLHSDGTRFESRLAYQLSHGSSKFSSVYPHERWNNAMTASFQILTYSLLLRILDVRGLNLSPATEVYRGFTESLHETREIER
jgi:hypothetical protein